jgi:hypothetical protein
MKLKQLLLSATFSLVAISTAFAQVCPAPNPGDANCYQTSRPSLGDPLTNWPPIPNQDCCNAIPLCQSVNIVDNETIIPEGAPAGTLYPGCVQNELPSDANTCFSNNEKGTTWYKFQIRPLPGGLTAPGSPAGKLRFRIIPGDVYDDPNYDPFADDGATGLGATDYDFLLFKIPATAATDGAACGAIKNSTAFGTNGSVIASCNWTGTRGPTGLFEPGTGTEFAQGPATRFNKTLDVKVGDLFYLAVDNFSVNTLGFTVDFRGLAELQSGENTDSTAIVNPPPTDSIKIASIKNPECQSQDFILTFDKPVRCDSVSIEKFQILCPQLPSLSMVSIAPVNGCNPGGQDSSFVFTVNPFTPGITFQIVITKDIRDICGNKVLFDTASFKIDSLKPLTFSITGKQPSCGITELTVEFAKPVFCDSVKASKWQILNNGTPFGVVKKVRRLNGGLGGPGCLDTLYVLSFTKAIKDSMNLQLALNGVIKDFCGNPVILDSLPFRINPFLSLKGDPLVVCPKKTTTLTAVLDSTFDGYAVDSLSFRWTNLNNSAQLVEDDSTSFAPNNEGIVKIKRDLIYPETVKYQVIVRNLINGCIDTAAVPVRFSARPDLEEPSILTYCFGEQFTFKPVFTNAKPSELVYSWYRKPNNLDTLSKDSVFTQTVDSALVSKGLEQIYVLNTRFTDSLGGCIANPTELKIRYGRHIMPKIDLDSSLRNASITPADFTFGNTSKFMPTKSNARFDWNFGQVITPVRTVTGLDAQSTVYNDPGTYNVRLTAYDTLYATTVQVGKICQNTDSIEINVQNLIPSLVTSNGDGVNDNFYIEGMRPNTFSMKLYNRWGKLVGEQDPFEINGWDPKAVAPGTYYYILTERRSGKTLVSWLNISRQ